MMLIGIALSLLLSLGFVVLAVWIFLSTDPSATGEAALRSAMTWFWLIFIAGSWSAIRRFRRPEMVRPPKYQPTKREWPEENG